MLKALRRKFILVNMLTLSLLMLAVATVSVVIAVREFRSGYEAALHFETSLGKDDKRAQQFFVPKDNGGAHGMGMGTDMNMSMGMNMPSFSAILNADGEWELRADWTNVDDATFALLIDRAQAEAAQSGFLRDLAVAYEKSDGRIAFVSTQTEYASLQNRIVGVGCIFLGAAAAFFILIYYLSGWAVRPVEKSWRQQQQLIADASHELKTPLTVILANTGIMERELGSNQWLENTRKEAESMKELLEGMLFLARSDEVRQPLPDSPVQFSDLVWERTLSYEVIAFEKNITVESDIEPDCSTRGDAPQLRRLLSILLDNAIKYTPAGGSVIVRLRPSRDRLLLTVNNSGDPIPPEQLSHLFDRFYRVDGARSTGGYGLGLAIAKEIVTRHNGSVSVQSSAPDGTVFSVLLPRM